MADLDLTAQVLQLRLNLTPGGDFVRTIEATEGSFAAGSAVTLDFTLGDGTHTLWPAAVDTFQAAWNVDKAAVDALIAAHPYYCVLTYTAGTVDLVWARGRPVVDR